MRAFFALLLWMGFSAPALAIVTFDEGNIILRTSQNEHPLHIQIANAPQQHQRGLMFRKELKPFDGMLFEFPKSQPVTMWMKDTPLPLDMIFFDETQKVVHIEANTIPYSLTTISSPVPVRYVLEVMAGTANTWGIQSGDSFAYEKK